MPFLFWIVTLCVIVAALADIIRRPESDVRHLPKMWWIIIVLFLPLIGSLVWFVIGPDYSARPHTQSAAQATPSVWGVASGVAGFERERPVSTEDQLAELNREIEAYEKQARLEWLEAEVQAKREAKRKPME